MIKIVVKPIWLRMQKVLSTHFRFQVFGWSRSSSKNCVGKIGGLLGNRLPGMSRVVHLLHRVFLNEVLMASWSNITCNVKWRNRMLLMICFGKILKPAVDGNSQNMFLTESIIPSLTSTCSQHCSYLVWRSCQTPVFLALKSTLFTLTQTIASVPGLLPWWPY